MAASMYNDGESDLKDLKNNASQQDNLQKGRKKDNKPVPRDKLAKDDWPSLLVGRETWQRKRYKKNPQAGVIEAVLFLPLTKWHAMHSCMAKDTIYLCNFRVSVDGEWLCLKELADVQFDIANNHESQHIYNEGKDPVVIERSNLVNVTKLVVKEVIESSLRYGRMLDSEHIPLQHFFILLEHVMRHGLKPKKGLLGPKKELWNVLEVVEKLMPEAADITSSVRDLPTVKTHLGRARAWLRLALMQKRLADYFRLLVDRKDILSEYYEEQALMTADEAVVIGGLLVGLNVIDCNLCVKEEDLDSQQGIIDFSLYLRDNSHLDSHSDGVETASMTAVLDQKNYIEELNRHLNATVTNLQQKVEQLQTTNALMKEDLAIAKNTILSLQEENNRVRHEQDLIADENARRMQSAISDLKLDLNAEGDLKKELHDEICRRQELERELVLQRSSRSEAEMALKLLEKDVHEKQDSVVSLRRQLEDIKVINLQLYNKLQECEASLRQKTEQATQLEQKTSDLATALQYLEAKVSHSEEGRLQAEDSRHKLWLQMAEKDQRRTTLESDLKIEREWRASLQAVVDEQKQQLITLQQELQHLRITAKEYDKLRSDLGVLEKKCAENELTLEEVGVQLKESQLQVEDLKETHRYMKEAIWTDDRDAKNCRQCNKPFSVARRKHHCRNCGEIFCNPCSDNTMPLPSSARPVRVCDSCHTLLLRRYSAT